MISRDPEKIGVRSLNEKLYVEDLPLNWFESKVDFFHRRVDKKSYRIMNREHEFDSFPEE